MSAHPLLFVAALSLGVALPTAATRGDGKAAPAEPAAKLKQYYFVMLHKGSHRDQDEATVARIQAGHLQHIETAAQAGKLHIAGPFADDGDWRGILIYYVPDNDAAKALCEADPAVQAGRLACEIHPWLAQPGSSLK